MTKSCSAKNIFISRNIVTQQSGLFASKARWQFFTQYFESQKRDFLFQALNCFRSLSDFYHYILFYWTFNRLFSNIVLVRTTSTVESTENPRMFTSTGKPPLPDERQQKCMTVLRFGLFHCLLYQHEINSLIIWRIFDASTDSMHLLLN